MVEGKESKTIISIQPPGTGTIGLAMLRAYQATGDPAFLDGADLFQSEGVDPSNGVQVAREKLGFLRR